MNETQNERPPTTQTRKHSGESRLGGVPKHWETRRLKGVCLFEYGDSLAEDYRTNTGFPVYGSNGLIGHTLAPNTERECLIIGRKGSSGKVLYSEEPAFAIDTTFFVDRRHTGANIRWLYYLLTSLNLESLSGDVGVPGLSRARAYQQACSYPPLDEQTAIVRFLDHADAQIQRYIASKERLIALLGEQRQALVHQAVTRGLDPNVKLKDSGVEWLGEVPENWEIRRLGQCTSVSGGATPSMEVNRFWGGSVPWVTPKDMKKDVISDSSMKVTDAAIHETSLQLVEPPVVLMVVRGMILARRVPIAYTTTPVTINQDMKALRTLRGTDAIFLAYSLNSVQEAFKPLIDEAGHGTRRLPTERWRELPITMPPPSEQRAIIEYLDNTKAEINAAIDRSRRQIDLMNEYRTRLIADVVTGQLDVRETAAELPNLEPAEIID